MKSKLMPLDPNLSTKLYFQGNQMHLENEDSLPVALSALSLYVADKMFSWMKLTHISMYFVSNFMKCNLILAS